MKTRRASKPEPRNLGVTVLAGALFVLTGSMATSFYNGSWLSTVAAIVLDFIALLSLLTAIYGRKKLLKELVRGLFFTTLP